MPFDVVTGAGTVFLSNATIGGNYAVTGPTIVSDGLVNFSGGAGPVTIVFNSLTINTGATLKGTDDLVVTGAFNWKNGTLQGVSGHGSLTVQSDMTLNDTYNVRDFVGAEKFGVSVLEPGPFLSGVGVLK